MKTAALASLASERAIIQSVAMDPGAMSEIEGLAAEDFAHLGHQDLWRLVQELDAAKSLTSDTLHQRAIEAGRALETVFTEVVLQQLGALTTANLGYHVAQVRDHALTRRVLALTSEYQDKARTDVLRGADLLEELARALAGLERSKPGDVLTVRDLVRRRFAEHDEAAAARARGEVVGYVPTGFDELDDIAFLRPGVVTALIARPGMGKSAVAQHIAGAAADAAVPVHYFSLEDGAQSFTDRMLAREAMGRISLGSQRSHRLEVGQLAELTRAAGELVRRRDRYMLFSPLTRRTARDVVAVARRAARRHATKLVVVDYLHKLRSPDPRANRFDALGLNCSELEDAAKENQWAVLVLCQVKRAVEERQDKRPRAEDIAGSDEVSQYMKAGLGLYRPAVYDDRADPREMELLIVKNNDGPAYRSIRVGWDGPTTRVYPLAPK